MNVPMKGGPAPTVAVVPLPESEMDALLLGRTAVRTFDQYMKNVCMSFCMTLNLSTCPLYHFINTQFRGNNKIKACLILIKDFVYF